MLTFYLRPNYLPYYFFLSSPILYTWDHILMVQILLHLILNLPQTLTMIYLDLALEGMVLYN